MEALASVLGSQLGALVAMDFVPLDSAPEDSESDDPDTSPNLMVFLLFIERVGLVDRCVASVTVCALLLDDVLGADFGVAPTWKEDEPAALHGESLLGVTFAGEDKGRPDCADDSPIATAGHWPKG